MSTKKKKDEKRSPEQVIAASEVYMIEVLDHDPWRCMLEIAEVPKTTIVREVNGEVVGCWIDLRAFVNVHNLNPHHFEAADKKDKA